MNYYAELKVLYVEDDDNTRKSLERFLKRRFGKVFLAENAEKGIEVFKEHQPDIAIIDILLPGMSGLDMIHYLRERGETCKFLITSTVNEPSTILKAIDLNIENYIVKPLDTGELEEKLGRISQSISEERTAAACSEDFILQNKKEIEEKIRKEFLKILKEYSGKGPRDAVVFISGDTVEITAYGILSTFDKTLIHDIKNTGHVEESRRLFYLCIEKPLSQQLKQEIGFSVSLLSAKIYAQKDRETARFEIDK